MSDQPGFSKAEVDIKAKKITDELVVLATVKLVDEFAPVRVGTLRRLVEGRVGERKVAWGLFDDLVLAGFLVELVLPKGDDSCYILGEVGRAHLYWQLRRGMPRDSLATYNRERSLLLHDSLIADFVAWVKLDVEKLGGRIVWHKVGSELGLERTGADWDALITINLLGMSKTYALEIDAATEDIGTFSRKVQGYNVHLTQPGAWSRLGIEPPLQVLVYAKCEEDRLERMREGVTGELAQLAEGRAAQQRWWFTSKDRFNESKVANPLIACIWDEAEIDVKPEHKVLGKPLWQCEGLLAKANEVLREKQQQLAVTPQGESLRREVAALRELVVELALRTAYQLPLITIWPDDGDFVPLLASRAKLEQMAVVGGYDGVADDWLAETREVLAGGAG